MYLIVILSHFCILFRLAEIPPSPGEKTYAAIHSKEIKSGGG
jgi:hypothetical protein